MIRRFSVICILFLVFLIAQVSADGSWSIDLVAGQNTTIGTVDFNISGESLTATFNVTVAGWCLETTHLYVDDVAPSRAAPGQFQYQHENLNCVVRDTYSVSAPSANVFVAAHAESDFDPARAVEADPVADTGQLLVNTGGGSYFDATVNVEGLATQYPAWCIDREHFITPGTTYDVDVYESGNALVDKPDSLDLVLYVINQDYSGLGATAEDVQTAIWELIDDFTVYLSPIAQQIVADAQANGEGFVPGCGQLMGVFMDAGADVQNIMVVIPAPCPVEGSPRSETAWSLDTWGVEFAQGWGMYFQLNDVPNIDLPTDEPATEEPIVTPTPPVTEEPIVTAPDNNGNSNSNGDRSRNDEAPGQDPANSAPGSRSDESRANGNGNGNTSNSNNSGNNGNGNGNNNGNGNGNSNGNGNG